MNEIHETKSLRIDYRHLAFFFVGAVCVCAVFFALGFVVGRAQAFETVLNQEDHKNTGTSATSSVTPLAASGKEGSSTLIEPTAKAEEARQRAPRVDYRKDLDFYAAVKEQEVDQNFHPESPKPTKTPAANKSPLESGSPMASTSGRNSGSRAGGVSLQVAALKSSAEADRLAKTLRSKGYPVFIVNPAKEDSSKLIRVQIGPYTSDAEAAKVKARLGTEGYTAISKR